MALHFEKGTISTKHVLKIKARMRDHKSLSPATQITTHLQLSTARRWIVRVNSGCEALRQESNLYLSMTSLRWNAHRGELSGPIRSWKRTRRGWLKRGPTPVFRGTYSKHHGLSDTNSRPMVATLLIHSTQALLESLLRRPRIPSCEGFDDTRRQFLFRGSLRSVMLIWASL